MGIIHLYPRHTKLGTKQKIIKYILCYWVVKMWRLKQNDNQIITVLSGAFVNEIFRIFWGPGVIAGLLELERD